MLLHTQKVQVLERGFVDTKASGIEIQIWVDDHGGNRDVHRGVEGSLSSCGDEQHSKVRVVRGPERRILLRMCSL